MKMLRSLLVLLATVVAGQGLALNTVADARRVQAEQTAKESKEESTRLAELATEEKKRILNDVRTPFGNDFAFLAVETKYATALKTINAEIAQAKRNLAQAQRALAKFQTDYKKNPTPYLLGVTKFPTFNNNALTSVVEFAKRIKAQLLASKSVGDAEPELTEVDAQQD